MLRGRGTCGYLRGEQKSDRTICLYRDAVTYLRRRLAEHGRPITSGILTRDVFVEYLAHSVATVAPGSALTRFKHLRTFCLFLVAEGDLPASPMTGLKPPEVPERPVPVLRDESLKALIMG